VTSRRPGRDWALGPSHVDGTQLTALDRCGPLGLVRLQKTAELGAATVVTGAAERMPLRQGIPSAIHVVVLGARGRRVFGGETDTRTTVRVGELDQWIGSCGSEELRRSCAGGRQKDGSDLVPRGIAGCEPSAR